ncbi:hypothetical protein LIER_03851 [Lithospermum erythrorhizon]|uniref:Uncharacterized protein n=1 Tax=Lithospermum erythrorhizon TaxID=34254 RepID=A0AAV3NZB0_LITER
MTLSELAVIAHRVEFYASSFRALQTHQELLDKEMTTIDWTFRASLRDMHSAIMGIVGCKNIGNLVGGVSRSAGIYLKFYIRKALQ